MDGCIVGRLKWGKSGVRKGRWGVVTSHDTITCWGVTGCHDRLDDGFPAQVDPVGGLDYLGGTG